MRGTIKSQPEMLCLMSLEKRVPVDHPLRTIKKNADGILKRLSPLFDGIYAEMGRASIPPERLLKSKLLMAFYSVRSDRLFCEMLEYNMLYLWFLDMDMTDKAWDHSSFSKDLSRAVEHEVGKLFFEEVVLLAKDEGLISDEHFSVDGTLIEAWASIKSMRAKDGSDGKKVEEAKKDDPGNPTINFHGEKRTNQTHQSTTDPEARLARKSNNTAAKPSFGAHALMENRNGLLMDIQVTSATEVKETEAAMEMVDRQKEERFIDPESLGADKGYHHRDFVKGLRERGISPHIAAVEGRRMEGLDGRTLRSQGYRVSQRLRKRTEEIFGWMKVIGGFRKTRYRGEARTQVFAYWVGAAYNLLRISRLQVAPT